MEHRLKRDRAIAHPHHFTVKLTPDRKTEVKVLAAQQGITIMVLIEKALTDFMCSRPRQIPPAPAPDGWQRIVFKVDQAMKEAVQALGYLHSVSAQDIISAALDSYLEKIAIRRPSVSLTLGRSYSNGQLSVAGSSENVQKN